VIVRRPSVRSGLLVLALCLLSVPVALAGPPTEQLRGAVDRVLKILGDPELKKEAKTRERREAIRAVAEDIFDFTEISRRSLGPHWQARTAEEREEFTRLFGDLLEHAYISKIDIYLTDKIEYVGETVDGDRGVIRTVIMTKQGETVPVDYHMLARGDRWRAYDVLLEGVSLVANYRSQFNTIIQRSGYADLVAKLRVKYAERVGARDGGKGRDVGGAAATAPPSPTR
jgi:phospholipid transport system substrate-binding protein